LSLGAASRPHQHRCHNRKTLHESRLHCVVRRPRRLCCRRRQQARLRNPSSTNPCRPI